MVAELSIISVNLATACMESFLFGIFFILWSGSTYLFLCRDKLVASDVSAAASSRSIWRTPMFMAGCLVCLSVTGVSNSFCTHIQHSDCLLALGSDRCEAIRRLRQFQGWGRAYRCPCGPLAVDGGHQDRISCDHCTNIRRNDCEWPLRFTRPQILTVTPDIPLVHCLEL